MANTVCITDSGTGFVPGVQGERTRDLPNTALETTDVFDSRTFGLFLRRMKGTRSIREFAELTNLSESFISKSLSGNIENRPTRRTLLKLLSSKTEKPINRRALAKAAGYSESELKALENEYMLEAENSQQLSAAATLTRYYGKDPFTAMCELMRALSQHYLKGDFASYFYREAGYFELTDSLTGQVYVGINAYLKSDDTDNAGISRNHVEEAAVFAIALSVGLSYNHIITSANATEKIVFILTDDERVYSGCRSALPQKRTKATIVVLTKDHQRFIKEDIIDGAENTSISVLG